MFKFIGGVVVGAILGLLVGSFRPSETKAQFKSVTDTAATAIAKGAASGQNAADQALGNGTAKK